MWGAGEIAFARSNRSLLYLMLRGLTRMAAIGEFDTADGAGFSMQADLPLVTAVAEAALAEAEPEEVAARHNEDKSGKQERKARRRREKDALRNEAEAAEQREESAAVAPAPPTAAASLLTAWPKLPPRHTVRVRVSTKHAKDGTQREASGGSSSLKALHQSIATLKQVRQSRATKVTQVEADLASLQ